MIREIKQLDTPPCSVETGVVQLLCAADEKYAMSLCVTLRTAAESLRADHQLKAFVIDGGISDESWEKIENSLAEFDVKIEKVIPKLDQVSDLAISHHISHTAYFRLLAAEWLPEEIDKVIYLDSDLLILSDLVELWELAENDYFCWAVPDIACPYIDARQARVNFKKSSPYLAAISPIPNYRELDLSGSAPYFNSGLMVVNLSKWRSENVSAQLLECLKNNAKHVWCWDQYALNVVFAERWGKLPLRWNQGAHAFQYPSSQHAPIAAAEFEEMIENPAVVHYTTEWKPWDYAKDDPSHQLFFEKLDDTAWCGWRPPSEPRNIKTLWNRLALRVIKFSVANYRRFYARFLYR